MSKFAKGSGPGTGNGNAGAHSYSSFNHYALLTMRQQDPLAKIGPLYECVMVNPQLYAKSA